MVQLVGVEAVALAAAVLQDLERSFQVGFECLLYGIVAEMRTGWMVDTRYVRADGMRHVDRVVEWLGHADEGVAGEVKVKEWRHVHEGD